MGKKKKAALANRLARMSDDERAKYLQRKTDAEEEARRRKEQLVESFMKNKLRKEDAFSRLNVAKINQHWHQVMRIEKCESMKRDVEYLRRWIRRTVTIKNGIITKLMAELDWQEELYGKNFEAHTRNIHNIIDFHSKNLEQLALQYTNDRKLLLFIMSNERQEMEDKYMTQIEHLKTIIYGQETMAKNEENEVRQKRIKYVDEVSSQNRIELQELQKGREKVICQQWIELSRLIKNYFEQTDLKRFHMIELQRNDALGLMEVNRHEIELQRREVELKKLSDEERSLISSQETQINYLREVIKGTTRRFFQLRKSLHRDISHDDRQLALLTTTSNSVIDAFTKISVKGRHLLHLVRSCEKLKQVERHKWQTGEGSEAESTSYTSSSTTSPVRPKTSPLKQSQFRHLRQLRSEEVFVVVKSKEDPLAIAKKSPKSTKLDLVTEAKLKARNCTNVDGVNQFRHLKKLEGLWSFYNAVELECLDLRGEKNRLVQENNRLKEKIRDALEASALGQSIPNAKSSSSVGSRRRYAFSAPPSSSKVC